MPLAGRSRGTRAVHGDTIDGVVLEGIETENVVQLGPQLVALQAWEELGFTPMLRSLGMNPSRIATAQLMITNTLVSLPDPLTGLDAAALGGRASHHRAQTERAGRGTAPDLPPPRS